jgi:hypothetical protein
MGSKIYFAYGSNINVEQMKRRCPQAIYQGIAILKNFKFIINSRGVATIIRDYRSKIYGIAWLITESDELNLDELEGVKYNCYYKQPVEIELLSGKIIEAFVYIAMESSIGFPRTGYLEKIISSAKKHSFPTWYLDELSKWREKD